MWSLNPYFIKNCTTCLFAHRRITNAKKANSANLFVLVLNTTEDEFKTATFCTYNNNNNRAQHKSYTRDVYSGCYFILKLQTITTMPC